MAVEPEPTYLSTFHHAVLLVFHCTLRSRSHVVYAVVTPPQKFPATKSNQILHAISLSSPKIGTLKSIDLRSCTFEGWNVSSFGDGSRTKECDSDFFLPQVCKPYCCDYIISYVTVKLVKSGPPYNMNDLILAFRTLFSFWQ